MSNRENSERVVWIEDEHVFGNIVGGLGAFFTTISYTKGGIEYEVLMENDEFQLLDSFFEYEPSWEFIPGTDEQYQASSDGDILGPSGKILSPKIDKDGYEQVVIIQNGARVTRMVHALVAETFLGPIPKGMEVCHNDDSRRNNSVDNLRYDTHRNNILDITDRPNNFNKNKTHCSNQHEFTEENTWLDKNGGRHCRVCNRDRARERRRIN